MGAGFDRDCLVNDIAFHPGGGGQAHLQTTDSTHDTAIHDDIIGHNLALDGGAIADGKQVGADIAFDSAFDLNIAGCLEVTGDVQIGREDRRGRFRLGSGRGRG